MTVSPTDFGDTSVVPPLTRAAWFATLAGLCGSLVAIGLARFAYTPLIPPLIEAHWFSSADAVTLGAANLAGYLAGALFGRPVAQLLSNRWALRLMMLVATVAFFACAYPLSVAWFFAWRFLSGISGGSIMVLVATTVLPHIPIAKRNFASGMIFLGLGLGIAASGTLIPGLLQLGLRQTWIGLGILSLFLTALSWFGWPSSEQPESTANVSKEKKVGTGISLWILYGQYAANALGLVPAMILLVDYVARGLGLGAATGSTYWILFGLAGIVGPMVTGYSSNRIGNRRTYRIALFLQIVALGLLAFTTNLASIGISTVILGLFTVGVVQIVLGRVHDILPNDNSAQRTAWSRATVIFSVFQALSAYGYAYIFKHTGGNYSLIFLCGLVALAAAFAVDFLDLSSKASGSLPDRASAEF